MQTTKEITAEDLVYVTEGENPYYLSGVLASEAKLFKAEELVKIHERFVLAGYQQGTIDLLPVCKEVLEAFEGVPLVHNNRQRYETLRSICEDWKNRYTHKQLLEIARACVNPDFIYRGDVRSLVRNFADAVLGRLV